MRLELSLNGVRTRISTEELSLTGELALGHPLTCDERRRLLGNYSQPEIPHRLGADEGCRAKIGLIDCRSVAWSASVRCRDGSMSEQVTNSPWYRDGLSFECTRCGACCTGAPGFVWVNDEEIARLAAFRGETTEQFSKQFVRQVGERFSLIEKPGGDCVFWDKKAGCTVYSARPVQCQTWPFWPENLETSESWTEVTERCPGSGRGQWFSLEEVEATAARVHT